MTILVAVKKNGRVFLGADRITTFGNEYFTDLVNGCKIIKAKHAYLATSGYTLMDNVLEHLHDTKHAIMDNKFETRADVFQFGLKLFAELKKEYTLTETGKETYASIYNVFLVVTDKAIYSIGNNLTVTEFPSYIAKGAGENYALGCFYALYDTVEDGRELARMALEAACHFCIYCKEPLDIIEVKASDFGTSRSRYKDHGELLHTVSAKKGASSIITQSKSSKSEQQLSVPKAKISAAKAGAEKPKKASSSIQSGAKKTKTRGR